MIIPYDSSKEERDKVVAEREKKLFESFEEMRKKIDEQIQGMNFSTVSERVRRQQLEEIRHELQKQLQGHYNALEAGLKDDMVEVGGAVLKESEAFYSALQMPIGMSITSFPVEIMNNIVNGSVYEEKWYLSKALWGDYTEKLDQINDVITQGVGLNLSSLEIAKQLEQYVDPKAMASSKTIVTDCLKDPVTGKLYSKDYVKRHPEKDWTGFTETKSRYRYGKVDYNAQRLARTLINHAYQQNVVHQAKANPFGTGVRWDASGGERMCEICEERDGKIFPVDDVPLDHPNGTCTFEVVTDLDMMEMSNVLANWVNGVPTDYDDKLDAWYNDRAEVPIERVPDMFAQHVIAEGRDISGEWERRPDQFDFAIEDVINAQGFDGLPRVVSKEEFESLEKDSLVVGFRGYSAKNDETLNEYSNNLRGGKWYVDCSVGTAVYGQGMYVQGCYVGSKDFDSANNLSRMFAEGYGMSRPGNVYKVEHVALPKDAKIAWVYDPSKPNDKPKERFSSVYFDFMQMKASDRDEWKKYDGDFGVYAASLGYDCISEIKPDTYFNEMRTGEFVVLNRTKLIIEG